MKDLKIFLTSYIIWAEEGAPNSKPYYQSYGLCSASFQCLELPINNQAYTELSEILERDFGDRKFYPFNVDVGDYFEEPNKALNPHRLAWARKILKELNDD